MLLGTGLHYNYYAMSQYNMFPDSMKSSEAEYSTLHSPSLNLNIPSNESKTDTYEAHTIKVQISKTVSEKCPWFTGGELEKYLQFFDIVSRFIRQKNLRLIPMRLEDSPKKKNFC